MRQKKNQIYNHLPAFTIHDLAQISDWLDETGELYVDFYPLHGGGGTLQALIRSLRDLKSFVQEQHFWDSAVFTIFRGVRFPLRGVADAPLLEQALQQFPPGHTFSVCEFGYYPEEFGVVTEGDTHADLLRAFASYWGQPLAIGIPPVEGEGSFDVDSFPDSADRPRNQWIYPPYDADPARYQWIMEMWQE